MPETPDPQAAKSRITDTFDLIAEGYDNPAQRFFPFAADYMITLAKPVPGERVLDIATGTGMAAIAAAQAITPGGRVQAIDLAENMIAKAQRNVSKHALSNVDFHLMDAEQLEFRSNYFDLITCAFGVFFFTDSVQALHSWLRVLKPGGRLIFTSFSRNTFQPMAQWFREAVEAAGVPFPEAAWQRLAEEPVCQQLVEQAGYQLTQVSTKQMGYHLASENDWWEIIWNSGFRGILNALTPEQQTSLRAQHLEQVAGLKTTDGIWLDVDVIFTQAQKPISD
jgi:ubiquinone/menaquinone biosynthesis C-methylase UbiE